jgi:acetyltransferase-like isoleucine patch superfamily enzyme
MAQRMLSPVEFFGIGNQPPGVCDSVRIHPTARIDCGELTIGSGGVIGEGCRIEGTRIEIGRELWLDAGARIGGGSCRDPQAFLKAGDYLHVGKLAELNIARGITIGDECGIGVGSGLYSHGAYLDELAGFPCSFAPITIGSRVWLPSAWVNPGVTIGSDVVVAARSLVNRSLPSGCLAGGTPAVALKAGVYPRKLSIEEKGAILDRIVAECRLIFPLSAIVRDGLAVVVVEDGATQMTVFDTEARTIAGPAGQRTEGVRNQLRRHGVRFRFSPTPDGYRPWDSAS